MAALIQVDPNKLDLEFLRIEEPVILRKRTNGTKLTWVGYKGEPNHALIRAIVTAQACVEEIKAGKSISDIMQAHKIPEGACSPASLVISNVWKPYMKDNCELDDLRTGFKIAEGYRIRHCLDANTQHAVGQGGLF